MGSLGNPSLTNDPSVGIQSAIMSSLGNPSLTYDQAMDINRVKSSLDNPNLIYDPSMTFKALYGFPGYPWFDLLSDFRHSRFSVGSMGNHSLT